MNRPLNQIKTPQFSGHETFTLRYGWLKKAYDFAAGPQENERSVFLREGAAARLGVGKNMVSSMRHWAKAAGIIADSNGTETVTDLGRFMFDAAEGRDPFMENPSTSWIIHWNISSSAAQKTTWFWAFNCFNEIDFERDAMERQLENLVSNMDWKRVAPSTIKRDVACFIRTYAAQPPSPKSTFEDEVESPLTELGLLTQQTRDRFRFIRGPKRSLGGGAFGYALAQFWRARFPGLTSLSFDALAHEPGSPGRVFLLDENSLFDLCGQLEEASKGIYRWSETAGLRQLVRTGETDEVHDLETLSMDYESSSFKRGRYAAVR